MSNIELPLIDCFEAFKAFSEGLATVMIGKKWGYIDKTGKEVVSTDFFNLGVIIKISLNNTVIIEIQKKNKR